jgi:hypothetical protein
MRVDAHLKKETDMSYDRKDHPCAMIILKANEFTALGGLSEPDQDMAREFWKDLEFRDDDSGAWTECLLSMD